MTCRIIELGDPGAQLAQNAREMFRSVYPIELTANIEFSQIKVARHWCFEEFGPSARVVHRPVFLYTGNRWLNYSRHFYFRDPDIAVMFKMVWG